MVAESRIHRLFDADKQPRSDKCINVGELAYDRKNVFVGSASDYQVMAAAAAWRCEGKAATSVAELDELRLCAPGSS